MLKLLYAIDGVDCKLGGTVDRKGWKVLSHDPCYAQILDYHAVRRKIVQLLKERYDLRHLVVVHQCIERDVELLSVGLTVCLDLADILEREVHCSLAGGKTLEPEIYGIGTALEGVQGALQRPCRKREFTCMKCVHFLSTRLQMASNVSGLRSCSTLQASSSAVSSCTPIFMKNCVRTLCLV